MSETAVIRRPWLLTGQRGGLPPSLDLKFLAAPLDPRITFTRASTATYFDSSGTMQTAAINAPRFDYDPVTHALNGLPVEEARTNLLLWSTDFTNAAWQLFNGATKGASITGPGGVATGMTLNFGAQANSQLFQTINVSAGTTLSVWARANTLNSLIVRFSSELSSTFTLTAQWQRFSFTCVGANTNLGFTNPGASAGSIDIAMPQLELGAFPTSYIPTTSAAVPRSADVATMSTGTWYSAATSSLVADFMVAQSPNPSATLVRDACALSDASANNRLMLRGQIVSAASAAFGTSIAGTTTASGSLGSPAANAPAKVGAAWNGTTGSGSLNGGPVVSYAVGLPAGLTTLAVGNDYSGATACLNGWVRRVRYWPRTLTNAELQSVTR